MFTSAVCVRRSRQIRASRNTYIQSGEWVIISSIKTKALTYFKSLQARIFLVFILVGMIPIFLMKYVILENYVTQSVAQKRSMIQGQCQDLVSQISQSGYIHGASSSAVDRQMKQLANLYNGRVIVVNSNFRIIRDTFGIDEDKYIISEEVLESFLGTDSSNYNQENEFLELTVPIKAEDTKEIEGILIVSVSTEDVDEGRDALNNTVWILQVVLTILICMTAFYMARLLTRPFGKITQSLEEVRGSVIEDQEISIPDYTETKLLSEAYNRMLRRMKLQEDSRQEFVSNVSHELKTPMTSMKVLADSLVGQEGVPEELYQEFMRDITAEIDRENKIITDLLSLVKMDKKAADLNVEHLNINQLLEDILKRLRPIADKRNIDLILDSFRPVEADVDEVKFTLAVSNLVENGIKYNVDDGWVRVTLDADHKYFYVKVADSGMGIPEDSIGRIFERFYRVDKSHSKEIGGTGLGLAITRSAVTMHHGTIQVASKEGEGTTFTVRIPLSYIP